MADPVTALSSSLPPNDERIHLTWTNPGTTFDTIRISQSPTGQNVWQIQYQGPPIITRYLYPLPALGFDYKVETMASGVLSVPTLVSNITMPLYCNDWPILLTDLSTPTLTAYLGLFDTWSGLQAQYVSNVKSYVPMGATYPKDFPALARYRQWSNTMDFALPPSLVMVDGTLFNTFQTMQNLRQMAPPRLSTFLWRDLRGLLTYARLLDYKEWPAEDGGWDVELIIEERQPPAYPLTTAL